MRLYKCGFSSPEEWPGILSRHFFLLLLPLTPISNKIVFLEGEARGGRVSCFSFPLHPFTNLSFNLWTRASQSWWQPAPQSYFHLCLRFIHDCFISTCPCANFVLPVFYTPPCHQKLVLEGEILFLCCHYFGLWSSLSHLFSTQEIDFPPPEHPGEPSPHIFSVI